MNDNLKSLENLLKVFDAKRIVSDDDVKSVLAGITQLLASFKQQNESLNQDTAGRVEELLNQVVAAHTALEAKLNDSLGTSRTEIHTTVDTKVSDALKQVQALAEEVKAMVPLDGKDANPADVVPLVLEQIKLPEQKEIILDDGEEIVAKINDLPTDEEAPKIDAAHIKNLPQTVRNVVNGPIGGMRNIWVYDESTLITKALGFIKFAGAGVQATVSNGIVIVTIPGGTGTASDELATDSGNHTTFTILHTPSAGTLLVINETTGQAVPSSAYTNTTTSIIFNSSQQVDDGAGTLVTPTFRARYFY